MTPDALCPSCFAAVERIELGDDGLCVACHYGVVLDSFRPTPGPGEVGGSVPTDSGESGGGPCGDGFHRRVGFGVGQEETC